MEGVGDLEENAFKYECLEAGITSKKIVAVALTAAMCLGLSMTAFAAKEYNTDWVWNSPDRLASTTKITPAQNGQRELVNGIYGSSIGHVTDQYGVDLEWNAKYLSTASWKSINSEGKVRDILKDAGYDVPDNYDIMPILAANITLDDGLGSNGAYAWLDMQEVGANPEAYEAGQVIQVLRETYAGSGEWEVVDATLVETDGRLQARVQLTNRSQSLVVLRVTEDGKAVKVLNKKTGEQTIIPVNPSGNTTGTSTNAAGSTSPSASPKTGEF